MRKVDVSFEESVCVGKGREVEVVSEFCDATEDAGCD